MGIANILKESKKAIKDWFNKQHTKLPATITDLEQHIFNMESLLQQGSSSVSMESICATIRGRMNALRFLKVEGKLLLEPDQIKTVVYGFYKDAYNVKPTIEVETIDLDFVKLSEDQYDLTRLMIGSEGTLGVVTEVTLRLQKIPEYSVVAMCNFPTIKDAADVAIATMLSGIQVSRVELLDEVQVRAVNIANGKNLPEVPTLMFEFIGTEAYSREQTSIVQRIVSEHNGSDFVFAEDPEAKKELWKIRKEALWACFAMEPNFEAMISDVCVPLSHLAELISRSKKELDASPLVCTVIAHAGDGNFHTVILFDPNQEEQRIEAERLNQFMVYTALSMEGTCTGEHGVGTGKMKYLEKELGIEALQTMKRIKTALDPNNIMNPGKLIPPHVCF
ncbi:hypothetical protein HRI_000781700 [Hibiscus trionum]|uniref:D-lactate dehydrogenase (cytochrome) n=1 Tax=Hibiscus trionum TaxID=183268 RepID=A0A9W7H4Y2_HIBTR|nr:hypothetical protein HRI_000781700 [Hibiscus trionum]